MFGNKYFYWRVRFDDERGCYWYRSNLGGYRVGMKVIVPVGDKGKWQIGTIVFAGVYRAETVPFPLIRTKGVVEKAGLFAEAKVKRHNAALDRCPYPPVDLSRASVKTAAGAVIYCTCRRERDLIRLLHTANRETNPLIENYPVSRERAIPPEAKRRLIQAIDLLNAKKNAQLQKERALKELELERDIEFEELMEDLDQYN